MTIWEFVSVALWLDIDSSDTWVVLKTFHVDFVIEVTNVSNDGVVLHLGHMFNHDDVLVTSASNEDISNANNTLESLYLKTFHACLEGTDWVNFGNNNSSSAGLHGSSATFTDITISADDNSFTSNHNMLLS